MGGGGVAGGPRVFLGGFGGRARGGGRESLAFAHFGGVGGGGTRAICGGCFVSSMVLYEFSVGRDVVAVVIIFGFWFLHLFFFLFFSTGGGRRHVYREKQIETEGRRRGESGAVFDLPARVSSKGKYIHTLEKIKRCRLRGFYPCVGKACRGSIHM